MRQYPIEQYRKQLPRLERKSRAMRNVAIWWASVAGVNLVVGILSGGMINLVLGGVVIVGAFGAAVTKKVYDEQISLIESGGKPIAVRQQLEKLDQQYQQWWCLADDEESVEELLENETIADMGHVIAVAERRAEKDVKSHWWRQEGSLWHQTQKFIDATQSVIEEEERAERQAAAEERRLAYEKDIAEVKARLQKDIAEAKARLQKAETEQRIAATKRWLEEQREWDAFKEDARVAARDRKERGDWYEPPVGVPTGIDPNDESLAKKIAEINERMNRSMLASFGIEWCSLYARPCCTGPQAYAILQNMRPRGDWKSFPCGNHYHLTRVVR
jgi:hypothetical protein